MAGILWDLVSEKQVFLLALIALAMDPPVVQVIMAGLTRPSTQRQRHLRAISNLGNIIIAFRVLVDGRVKPGHDEKPEK